MKKLLTDLLICPTCIPQENKLNIYQKEKIEDDILTGVLECEKCGTAYPIQDGLAFLLPTPYSNIRKSPSRYESSPIVSSYLWSHYGDLLMEGDEVNTAYRKWAGLLQNDSGLSLDAGCAVGRFSFEMSQHSDFVVGIDSSLPFIRKARRLMLDGQLKVSITEEGLLTKQRTIHLPGRWDSKKVEFIVADIQSLPFCSDSFSLLASLNLVDKVPLPLVHLKEMNRVAKKSDAQFLFSDPFSWSKDIARKGDWLGGTTQGPYSGRGLDNVISLLTGEKEDLSPPWKIEKKGHIWWKIRNHVNHFELIRSWFLRAGR